jgi:uncharacterized membrane protein YuzA (DUF378 family)
MTTFTRIVYILVGIAGLYSISFFARDRGVTEQQEK